MKKKRRLKKGPVAVLIIIILVISIGTYKIINKPKVKEKDKEIEEPITPPKEEKKSPLEMSLSEFTLEGYFEGTVLTEKEVDDDYMSNIIYAGDSVALYYTINKINRKEVWHQISINPKTAQTCDVYVNSVKKYSSYVELFKEKQPEIVIMTMGTNGVSTMDKDYFIEQYEIFLKSIMKASPNTTLIIQSIPPVPIEMCERLNLKFLFSANAMKDEKGGCKEGYCTKDLHPSKDGNDALYEYAKKHLGSIN